MDKVADTDIDIIVTGARGFLGNHFLKVLPEGWKVTVIDKQTYSGVNPVGNDYLMDISSPGSYEIIKSISPRYIVNFAAESHVDRSLDTYSSFLQSNTLGVENLVKAARDAGVERFLQVSTDEVYGPAGEEPFPEEAPLLPCNPYASSKAAGELVAMGYYRSDQVPVIITRGANTYGSKQYPEKLIPFFLTRLLQGKKVPLYGSGEQEREWISVDDHCRGILTALRKGTVGEIYNIGSGVHRSNLEITKKILKVLGKSEDYVKYIEDPRGKSHDKKYSISSEKLRALGWAPGVTSIISTITWYENHREWWEPLVEDKSYKDYVSNFYGKLLGEDL